MRQLEHRKRRRDGKRTCETRRPSHISRLPDPSLRANRERKTSLVEEDVRTIDLNLEGSAGIGVLAVNGDAKRISSEDGTRREGKREETNT